MVLCCGLNLSTKFAGSGASQLVQAKVSCYLCSARATYHELQSDLQIQLLGLDLKVPRRGQAAHQDWLLLVPNLGLLNEEYGTQ